MQIGVTIDSHLESDLNLLGELLGIRILHYVRGVMMLVLECLAALEFPREVRIQ